MTTIKLGRRNAAAVRGVLGQLARCGEEDLAQSAAYWSGVIRHRMGARDVQTIAWLLLDASGRRSLPTRQRLAARAWAVRLEGRS